MRQKRVLCAAVCAALAVLMLLASACNYKVPATDYGSYPAQPLPDYASYLEDATIAAKLGGDGILVVARDAQKAYRNGAYIALDTAAATLVAQPQEGEPVDESELKLSQKMIVADAAQIAALMGLEYSGDDITDPDAIAKALSLQLVRYDKKLLIYSKGNIDVDVFSDLYMLEALWLNLSEAEEPDVVNSFIDLPNMVSNGTTNSVYYTAPDLQLGLQTNIYYAQLGDVTVTAGPAIVAGQGENPNNNTLVRIFNRQQAIETQFLAFPAKVRGGVRVAAGMTDAGGTEETIIATAAFDVSSGGSAKALRLFDTFGLLRASVEVKGIEGPYSIVTGRFVAGSTNEFVAVMGTAQSGNSGVLNIYSLYDGSLQSSVTLSYSEAVAAQRVELAMSRGEKNDTILLYFTEGNYACRLDPVAGTVERLELELPESANGVYDSAFDDEFAVTMRDPGGTFSYLTVYASSKTGSLLNVGWRENRFYSTAAPRNPTGYVDYADFIHQRTDIAARLMIPIEYGADPVETFANAKYDDWFYEPSATLYHEHYNMWEPCFTHRWVPTNAFKALDAVQDEDGNWLYSAVSRLNDKESYLELDASFLVGTYADGILDMAKLRIYPLRMYLQHLATEFRGENAEPEKLVAVSPVHEQEINVPGSLGDYNVNMIRGFREYLIGLYGSLENVNKRFNTNFRTPEEFDAPRFDPKQDDPSLCRGQWDVYGGSDFSTQWSLYIRYIINKRLMEAYREALLAGFPPETINAHQIPEGDATLGFLGNADTRMSPIEAVTACGTAYGGTRYGAWYADADGNENEKNFLKMAFDAGHCNITLGEYCMLVMNRKDARKQLEYMFEHGVRMIHVVVPWAEGSDDYKRTMEAEVNAVSEFADTNTPRTVNTGVTKGLQAVLQGDVRYNIVQMSRPEGEDSMNVGLLKSVLQDGSWEGTVYLVPFHAYVMVNEIQISGNTRRGFLSKPIENLQYGDQVEFTVQARYTGKGDAKMRIEVYNGDYRFDDATVVYDLSDTTTAYRYVLSNQLSPEGIRFKVTFEAKNPSKISLENMELTAQYEDIAHKYFFDYEASASTGGVTFDLLSRDMVG